MQKSNKIRQFLAIAIVGAGLSLAVPIILKVYREKAPLPAADRLPAADVSLQKIHYAETKMGKKRWDLLADRADYDKRKDLTRLAGVQLTVVSDGPEGDIKLVADHADYHIASGDLELAGNVKARSRSGMRFTTNTVAYQSARALITTADPVSFSHGMMAVEGVGMALDTNARTVRILHRVTANITPGNKNK